MMEFVNGKDDTFFTFWVLHVIVPGVVPCNGEKTGCGAYTLPMVVRLHDTDGHKICHHIPVKLAGHRGASVASIECALYKSVNCPGDDCIEPCRVNFCTCSAKIACLVSPCHSFMCTGPMIATATAATSKKERSQLREPHMQNGGGFDCITSDGALVE